MTKQEFNKQVKQQVKTILKGSATALLDALQYQNDYRQYGIEEMSAEELIKEIAMCNVLGISFIDQYTEAEIEKLILEN